MEDRIKRVMSAVFKVSAKIIDKNASPDTIGNWDSLGHIRLVLALEDEFGIHLADQEIIEMTNYKRIETTIRSKQRANAK